MGTETPASGATLPIGPDAGEIREELARILADPAFEASARRREMLRFLVEESLAGRSHLLKGTAVAMAAFGRGADFDPQADPVVRIEARRLRRDLDSFYMGAGATHPLRIAIPKGGYAPSFGRAVAALPPPAAAPEPAPVAKTVTTPTPAPPPPGGLRISTLPALASLAALALAAVVAVSALRGPEAAAPPVRLAELRTPTILVLPFETLSASEEDRFLAAGVTQALIGDLLRFSALRLYSAETSFGQFSGAAPQELASTLDVGYMVRGSVRSEDGRVVVGAQLVEAATGRVLWSETSGRALSTRGMLDLQAEIAADIAAAIGAPYGALRSDQRARVAAGADPSLASYACVLEAYEYRRTNKAELYGATRACLEAAVRADPDYAEAWAMLAYLRLDAHRFGIEPDLAAEAAYVSAIAAAERALALEPDNVAALKALSLVHHYAGRPDEAERLARRAVELNPGDPDALFHLGWRLFVTGDFDAGADYLGRAVERTLDPPAIYLQPLAIHRLMAGDCNGMLDYAERAVRDDSAISHALLAIAQGCLGRQKEAAASLDRMAERWPLLAADPEAAFAKHRLHPDAVAAVVAGLRRAGWTSSSG